MEHVAERYRRVGGVGSFDHLVARAMIEPGRVPWRSEVDDSTKRAHNTRSSGITHQDKGTKRTKQSPSSHYAIFLRRRAGGVGGTQWH